MKTRRLLRLPGLLVTLALPLYAMLSKSFSTFSFDLTNFEFQVDSGAGWGEPVTAAILNDRLQKFEPADLATSSDGRLAVTEFFADFGVDWPFFEETFH